MSWWEMWRVPWTRDEDERLRRFVDRYGTNCWSTAPDRAGLLRDARLCRERWHFYLSPDIKCGPITAEEEELIIRLRAIYGGDSYVVGRAMNTTIFHA
jgi:myb proto-oncogene protein